MAYIAFASAKGSPGVTTAVAALAATWPTDRDLLVVELDPAGGDLVVRFDLATEPGLVTLAAAGRRELGAATLLAHTQTLPSVVAEGGPSRRVLVAPVSADQAGASLSALRGGLPRALDAVDADVLVDCGRLDPASAAYEFATAAELLVMVARPVVAEVHHLAARLASVKSKAVSVLLVGDRPYPVSDVALAVGATPLGTLPIDARAASALTEGHPNAVRLLRRSGLLRDARSVAEALAGWLGPVPASDAAARPVQATPPVPGVPEAQPPTAPAPPVPPPDGGSTPMPFGPPPVPPPPPWSPAPSGPAPSSTAPGAASLTGAPLPPAPVAPAQPGPVVLSGPHAPDDDAPGPVAPSPPAGMPSEPPVIAASSQVATRLRANGRGGGRDEAAPKHFRRGGDEDPRR